MWSRLVSSTRLASLGVCVFGMTSPIQDCGTTLPDIIETCDLACEDLDENTRAHLVLGPPTFSSVPGSGEVMVPISGSFHPDDEIVTVSFAIDYNSSCLQFVGIQGASGLSATASEGSTDISTPGFDRHIVGSITTSTPLTGCDNALATVTFEFADPPAGDCSIRWDSSDPSAGLPNTVLETTDTAPNDQIRPSFIAFCNIALDNCQLAQLIVQSEIGDYDPGDWRNRGEYVSAVAALGDDRRDAGLIENRCGGCIVSQFARRVPIANQTQCFDN